MKITKAMVEHSAGASIETHFGKIINIIVVFSDGKKARILGKPGDPIESLKKGEVINVIDDKGWVKYIGKFSKVAELVDAIPQV